MRTVPSVGIERQAHSQCELIEPGSLLPGSGGMSPALLVQVPCHWLLNDRGRRFGTPSRQRITHTGSICRQQGSRKGPALTGQGGRVRALALYVLAWFRWWCMFAEFKFRSRYPARPVEAERLTVLRF